MVSFYNVFVACNETATIQDVIGKQISTTSLFPTAFRKSLLEYFLPCSCTNVECFFFQYITSFHVCTYLHTKTIHTLHTYYYKFVAYEYQAPKVASGGVE